MYFINSAMDVDLPTSIDIGSLQDCKYAIIYLFAWFVHWNKSNTTITNTNWTQNRKDACEHTSVAAINNLIVIIDAT